MKRYTRVLLALLLLASSALHAQGAAPITFSTAPTQSPEETIRLYTPLMVYLSQATGREFVIDPANNFVEYTVRIRLKKYDMLFDDSHLCSWRMANIGHTLLVRLPGEIRIVVIAPENSPIKSIAEMESGEPRVCAFPSPDVATLVFLSYFSNPARHPMTIRAEGVGELIECLRHRRGDGAVMRAEQWQALDQSGLKLVAAPERGYPERTVTLSNRLDDTLRQQIQQALLSVEGRKASQTVLAHFHMEGFVVADPSEYESLDRLLSSMWGFHAR